MARCETPDAGRACTARLTSRPEELDHHMRHARVTFAAGILAVVVGSMAATRASQGPPAQAQAAANLTGLHDFDFLVGEWRVRHRYLRVKGERRDWVEVDGTCSMRALMEGRANLEEHTLHAPGGVYGAIGLRAYETATGQWAIWWLDGRDPSGNLDPPVKGRFENGVGTFYADITLDDKPVRVRFIWSRVTRTSARWEQAYSADAGRTWETNWIMDFQRMASPAPPPAPAGAAGVASTPAPAAADLTGLHDFDFQVGEWRVHHRRLKPGSREWMEFDGTCRNSPLMGGRANLEEHTLNAPAGPYRAIGLRAYDPNTGRWAIRWRDERYPSFPLDPPVTGRFENGVGSFYSDYESEGKPMRVRYMWSHITRSSARWEQATSADAGKTWDTNWIMEFRRVS